DATADHVAPRVELPLEHPGAPAVEGCRAPCFAHDVHGVGDERSVSEPGVPVRGERGRGQVGALGRLPLEDHLTAAPCERVPPVSRGQPFTPLDATPLTNARWKTTKMTITGTIAMSDAANTSPHCVACWPWNSRTAIGRVLRLTSLMIVSAQVNSSQLPRNEKITEVPMAGIAMGSTTRTKVV